MRALIEASAHCHQLGPSTAPGKTHHRVIADHLRATSFLIADGVLPANDGRGYVLRRIMPTAPCDNAHMLGAQDPVMHRLVPALGNADGRPFHRIARGAGADCPKPLRAEETRFRQTLERGLKLLDAEMADLSEDADLPGATAFKLYDTFGFPLDLTQDALRERRSQGRCGWVRRSYGRPKRPARVRHGPARAKRRMQPSGSTLPTAWGGTEFLGYKTENSRRAGAGTGDRRCRGRSRRGPWSRLSPIRRLFMPKSGGPARRQRVSSAPRRALRK